MGVRLKFEGTLIIEGFQNLRFLIISTHSPCLRSPPFKSPPHIPIHVHVIKKLLNMWCTVSFKMYCAFLCGSLFGWTVCLHDGPGAAWNRPRGSNFQFMRMRIGEKV